MPWQKPMKTYAIILGRFRKKVNRVAKGTRVISATATQKCDVLIVLDNWSDRKGFTEQKWKQRWGNSVKRGLYLTSVEEMKIELIKDPMEWISQPGGQGLKLKTKGIQACLVSGFQNQIPKPLGFGIISWCKAGWWKWTRCREKEREVKIIKRLIRLPKYIVNAVSWWALFQGKVD